MVLRPFAAGASLVLAPGDAAGRSWKRPAAAVAVAVAAYAGLSAAFFRAAGRGADAFVVVPQAIGEAEAPPWLPRSEIARVNALGGAVRGRSVLDPDLARDLAGCYTESPWVSRVLHVRRAYPNRLDVALAIRRPFAVVRRSSGPAVVLDFAGFRLPASADPSGLPVMTGLATFPPLPGEVWNDVRALDGLRVLARYGSFLGKHPGLAPLRAREVNVRNWSRPDGRPVVEILTAKGCRIVWGVDLPDGSATVGEPSAQEKLARLGEVLPKLLKETRAVAYVSVRHRSGASLKFKDEGTSSAGAR